MKYIISILIFILAIATAVGLYSTSPKTKKAKPARPVPVVQTAEVHQGREAVTIEAFGTVIPAKRITLQSEVEGRIVDQHPELVPGGLIGKDDMLIQIDPADYELSVREYKAEMEEAMFELDLEQGRQAIAGREWKLMEDEIKYTSAGKSLALREPHLRLVRAKVEKAKSRLSIAELALARTTVSVPFNALVLEEFVESGQLVGRQTNIATLAGTDQFWVKVSIPVSALQRLSINGISKQPGPSAQVIFEPVSGSAVIRNGQVAKVMGDLDPEGRMGRLLIAIDDPLDLHANNPINKKRKKAGRLLLGSYVQVKIDAGLLNNIYSIPRQALREGNVIWVMDSEEKLQIRSVKIEWRRKDNVLVSAELMKGDKLILSRLQTPLPGMKIRSVTE